MCFGIIFLVGGGFPVPMHVACGWWLVAGGWSEDRGGGKMDEVL